jgi:hypothetical protein
MKKLFTLLAFVLMGSSFSFAQTDVTCSPALPCTFDESWNGNFLATTGGAVKEGDKFIFTAEPYTPDKSTWTYGGQILPKNNADWKNLSATLSVKAAGTFTFTLTADDAAKINAGNGLRVQGVDCIVTALKYQSSVEYAETGTEITFDEYGNITSDKFAGFSDGAKVVFTYTITGELTNASGSIQGWGVGSIKSLDGSVSVGDLAAVQLGDNSVSFTIGDMKAALEAPANQYNMQGVNWNVWNQGNAVVTRKSVMVYETKAVATAIGQVQPQVTPAVQGTSYNLSGQRVDASYRGIVIRDGKKVVVR